MKTLIPAAALVLACLSAPALAERSNKWRIEVDDAARASGEVELSFTPAGAEATTIVVPIPAGTGEDTAAALIRTAIDQRFGEGVYATEIDDGEDVLVKAHGSTPDFDLVLVRNTATGLELDLERE
ncbi:MAG TPA: hypothetical protein VF422_05355 [Dokdonella sp.]